MAKNLSTGIVLPDSNDNVSRVYERTNLQIINDKIIEGEGSLASHLADYASYKADNEYPLATVVGTQIQITHESDSTVYKFKLAADVTGGAITISEDTGVTSLPLLNVEGIAITDLGKGFMEVIKDVANFTLRPREGGVKIDVIDKTYPLTTGDIANKGDMYKLVNCAVKTQDLNIYNTLVKYREMTDLTTPSPYSLSGYRSGIGRIGNFIFVTYACSNGTQTQANQVLSVYEYNPTTDQIVLRDSKTVFTNDTWASSVLLLPLSVDRILLWKSTTNDDDSRKTRAYCYSFNGSVLTQILNGYDVGLSGTLSDVLMLEECALCLGTFNASPYGFEVYLVRPISTYPYYEKVATHTTISNPIHYGCQLIRLAENKIWIVTVASNGSYLDVYLFLLTVNQSAFTLSLNDGPTYLRSVGSDSVSRATQQMLVTEDTSTVLRAIYCYVYHETVYPYPYYTKYGLLEISKSTFMPLFNNANNTISQTSDILSGSFNFGTYRGILLSNTVLNAKVAQNAVVASSIVKANKAEEGKAGLMLAFDGKILIVSGNQSSKITFSWYYPKINFDGHISSIDGTNVNVKQFN